MIGPTRSDLVDQLESVINELDLSDATIAHHGPMGTEPAELVRLVLEQKDAEIAMLKAGFRGAGEGQLEQTAEAARIPPPSACRDPKRLARIRPKTVATWLKAMGWEPAVAPDQGWYWYPGGQGTLWVSGAPDMVERMAEPHDLWPFQVLAELVAMQEAEGDGDPCFGCDLCDDRPDGPHPDCPYGSEFEATEEEIEDGPS